MEENKLLRRVVCGAKTRKGTPCLQSPIKGKKRCRIHGGRSTGPPLGSQNARKCGFFSSVLTDEEKDKWDTIPVGDLDQLIRTLYTRADRILEHERAERERHAADVAAGRQADQSTVGMQVQEIVMERETVGGAEVKSNVKQKRNRIDYDARLIQVTRTIAHAEAVRSQLVAQGAGRDATSDEKALAARRAFLAMGSESEGEDDDGDSG